jgi:hypothetical protein
MNRCQWTPESILLCCPLPPQPWPTAESTSLQPTWGAPRMHGELLKLGFDLSERTIFRGMDSG